MANKLREFADQGEWLNVWWSFTARLLPPVPRRHRPSHPFHSPRRAALALKSAATLIPPAFGLAGVNLHTWTGWGSVPHWNAFVANLEMHGKGTSSIRV